MEWLGVSVILVSLGSVDYRLLCNSLRQSCKCHPGPNLGVGIKIPYVSGSSVLELLIIR